MCKIACRIGLSDELLLKINTAFTEEKLEELLCFITFENPKKSIAQAIASCIKYAKNSLKINEN